MVQTFVKDLSLFRGHAALRSLSFAFLAVLVDPLARAVGDFFQDGQIIPAKRVGGIPPLAVVIDPLKRDVVPRSIFGLVGPDRRLDSPEANLMHGASRTVSRLT